MTQPPANRNFPSPWLVRGVWCAVVGLVLIGVTATVARSLFPADLVRRLETYRAQTFQAFHRIDPLLSQRGPELEQIDLRFGTHPLVTMLHIVPGGVFLILATLQFSSRIRTRHLRFHQWSGRFLVLMAFVTVVTGFFFGLFMPYGGAGEATVIALVGGLFLVSLGKALIAIRNRQVARHREWMIRAFAVALGIATVRIVAAVLDVTLTPAGFDLKTVFVLSLWMGWAITLGGAEWWIRLTRPQSLSPASLVRAD